MNKKASGSYRARMNMRGYEQQVGINVSIRVVHVLLIMLWWASHITDVKGAFLPTEFGNDEIIYFKVYQVFQPHYDSDKYLLRLYKTAYGL